MAYTDELFRVVDKYFMEIIMPYGRTNAEAGEYLKKFKPFQKKNFDNYMQRFDRHREAAEALSMDEIAGQDQVCAEPQNFRHALRAERQVL